MTLIIFNDLVAGLSFSKPNWLTADAIADPVTLTHEPSNQFDARAIRVDHTGLKLGHIPKDQTAQIHSAWDNGLSVLCHIRNISFGASYPKVWLRATVELPSE